DPVVDQALGHAEGVLATDRDQRVHTLLGQRGANLVDAVVLVRVGSRRPEDGAAAGEDVLHVVQSQRPAAAGARTRPAVTEPDDVPPVLPDPLADHSANPRVQTRAATAAGQHTYTHLSSEKPPRPRP